MTAETIYRQMLNTFHTQTGLAMDDGCDLAVRLWAAAAELETLYQYADWSRRQAFPQTADGEYLDRHGQMRGLQRRAATRATGAVRFVLAQDHADAVSLAAGTELLTEEGQRVRLTDAASIPAGQRFYVCNAYSGSVGAAGNLPNNTALYLRQGPASIERIYAFGAFTGGAETEDDESFRARVLESFRPGSNGANAACYQALAKSVDGIVACSVIPDPQAPWELALYVADAAGMPSQGQLNEVTALLESRRELGIEVSVEEPTPLELSVSAAVRCKEGVDYGAAAPTLRAAIEACFGGTCLGKPVYASALSHAVFETGLVSDCAVTLSPQANSVAADQLPVLDGLTLTEAT